MTHARTFAGLVAGLLLPVIAGAQGANAKAAPGFIRAHMIAIDSKNRMYTGEAGNGRRMQRWMLKGRKPASSVKPPVQEQ